MLGGHESREYIETSATNGEVVNAAADRHAAQLEDAKPAPLGAELVGELLEDNHPVRDALQLAIAPFGCPVVQHEHGTITAAEELLERQDLPAIAQCALCHQA